MQKFYFESMKWYVNCIKCKLRALDDDYIFLV